jgi:hypothetical protein
MKIQSHYPVQKPSILQQEGSVHNCFLWKRYYDYLLWQFHYNISKNLVQH